jgi:predicted DNA-binding ribbon-helix-helix protein
VKKHNTHLLLPEDLWRQLEARAVAKSCTVTSLVVEALENYIKRSKP